MRRLDDFSLDVTEALALAELVEAGIEPMNLDSPSRKPINPLTFCVGNLRFVRHDYYWEVVGVLRYGVVEKAINRLSQYIYPCGFKPGTIQLWELAEARLGGSSISNETKDKPVLDYSTQIALHNLADLSIVKPTTLQEISNSFNLLKLNSAETMETYIPFCFIYTQNALKFFVSLLKEYKYQGFGG